MNIGLLLPCKQHQLYQLMWEIRLTLTRCCSLLFPNQHNPGHLCLPFAQPNLTSLLRSWSFKPPTWHSLLATLFVCSCLTLQCHASDRFAGFEPACPASFTSTCSFSCLTKTLPVFLILGQVLLLGIISWIIWMLYSLVLWNWFLTNYDHLQNSPPLFACCTWDLFISFYICACKKVTWTETLAVDSSRAWTSSERSGI